MAQLIDSLIERRETLYTNETVLILPATTLGSDDQHMRMGFGRTAFGEALEKFEAYLRNEM